MSIDSICVFKYDKKKPLDYCFLCFCVSDIGVWHFYDLLPTEM